MTTRAALPAVFAALLLATACGGDDRSAPHDEIPMPSKAASTPTPATDSAVIDAEYPAGDHGGRMALKCWGSGSPTIVLEAGDDTGYAVFPMAMVDAFAASHLTCGYDRIGTGASDAPTTRRRTITDVADDLSRLLRMAGVPEPYVLVGSSGGGLIAVEFAADHAGVVAGLALLDVGVPNPHLDREFPGPKAWAGPEHIDWVAGERRMARLALPIGDFPALVLAAEDSGDPHPEAQRRWSSLTSATAFKIVPGDHDFYEQYPEETAARVLSMVDR